MTWQETGRHGALGFTTRIDHQHLDGSQHVATSRRTRKGRGPLVRGPAAPPPAASPWLRFWAPDRMSWWIWLIFTAGSMFFLVGSTWSVFPHPLGLPAMDNWWINVCFFIGSVWFTIGSYVQYFQVINSAPMPHPVHGAAAPRRRWLAWQPGRIDFWLAAIQQIGALVFNINCWDSINPPAGALAQDIAIWGPGSTGGICFVAAGWLAMVEVCHRLWCWRWRELDWWIAFFNTAGAIGFLLNGLLGLVIPGLLPGWDVAAAWALWIGSVLFLFGSYLLLPETFSN